MKRVAGVLLLALAACGRPTAAPPTPAPLSDPPPPRLVAHEAALTKLAASGPVPPDAKKLAELAELAALAFGGEASDRRLASRSHAALRDDPAARWGLEIAIRHDDVAIRRGALALLAEQPRQASWPDLLMRLKYELQPFARLDVLRALALHGNAAGLAELAASFQRSDLADQAGAYAIEILQKCGRDPGTAPSWEQLGQGLLELAREWTDTGRAAALPQPTPEPELLRARLARHLAALNGFQLRPVDDARFVVSRSGGLGLELVAPCVLAQEALLRSHSLEICQQLGVVAAPLTEAVLSLLGDPLTRAEAVRTLGRLRATQAAPRIRAWLDHPALEVRCAAAGALGPLGDRSAIGVLRGLMDDGKQPMDLRVQAAFSLAIFELDRPGRAFLQARRQDGSYHEPTLSELLDTVDRWR